MSLYALGVLLIAFWLPWIQVATTFGTAYGKWGISIPKLVMVLREGSHLSMAGITGWRFALTAYYLIPALCVLTGALYCVKQKKWFKPALALTYLATIGLLLALPIVLKKGMDGYLALLLTSKVSFGYFVAWAAAIVGVVGFVINLKLDYFEDHLVDNDVFKSGKRALETEDPYKKGFLFIGIGFVFALLFPLFSADWEDALLAGLLVAVAVLGYLKVKSPVGEKTAETLSIFSKFVEDIKAQSKLLNGLSKNHITIQVVSFAIIVVNAFSIRGYLINQFIDAATFFAWLALGILLVITFAERNKKAVYQILYFSFAIFCYTFLYSAVLSGYGIIRLSAGLKALVSWYVLQTARECLEKTEAS